MLLLLKITFVRYSLDMKMKCFIDNIHIALLLTPYYPKRHLSEGKLLKRTKIAVLVSDKKNIFRYLYLSIFQILQKPLIFYYSSMLLLMAFID